MSKFCMSCGAANVDNANVCNRCHKPLASGPVPAYQGGSTGFPQHRQHQKSGMGKLMVIGIIAVLVVVAIAAGKQFEKIMEQKKQEELLIQKASDFMRKKGITSFTSKACEGNIVTFEVNQQYEYAKLSGELSVKTYQETLGGGNREWKGEFENTESCAINWDIDKLTGTWKGEEENKYFSGSSYIVTIGSKGGNTLALRYEMNDSEDSWDEDCTLPQKLSEIDAVDSIGLLDSYTIKTLGGGVSVTSERGINTSIKVVFNGIEVNGYNTTADIVIRHAELTKES